jgi:hypothetical protein
MAEQSTKVVTGTNIRFSYVKVFEPKAIVDGGDPKYSVCLLIPKSDKATLKTIDAALDAAIAKGKADTWKKKVPRDAKSILRDGDVEREDSEEYEGMMFINAYSASKDKPGVVGTQRDAQGKLLPIGPDEFYSGCIGRASFNFYPYNAAGNIGVACGLLNLQKISDGDKLSGGGSSAEADFGDEEDDLLG